MLRRSKSRGRILAQLGMLAAEPLIKVITARDKFHLRQSAEALGRQIINAYYSPDAQSLFGRWAHGSTELVKSKSTTRATGFAAHWK